MEAAKNNAFAGKTFGRWTVQEGEPCFSACGERKWPCLCACGAKRYVLERSLKTGESLSCGCLRSDMAKAHSRQKDISGQRFGSLVALSPTQARDAKGNVVWHCRCDCGNEADISYNVLLYTHVISCGCRRQAHNQTINRYLTHVDGTSLEILRSEKIPKNNTTGVKGVYRFRGKFLAKIVFKRKQYVLGIYETIGEAAQRRKEAEEAINQTVVAYYEKWEARARKDPQWARENPVRLLVNRTGAGRIFLTCLPELE